MRMSSSNCDGSHTANCNSCSDISTAPLALTLHSVDTPTRMTEPRYIQTVLIYKMKSPLSLWMGTAANGWAANGLFRHRRMASSETASLDSGGAPLIWLEIALCLDACQRWWIRMARPRYEHRVSLIGSVSQSGDRTLPEMTLVILRHILWRMLLEAIHMH